MANASPGGSSRDLEEIAKQLGPSSLERTLAAKARAKELTPLWYRTGPAEHG